MVSLTYHCFLGSILNLIFYQYLNSLLRKQLTTLPLELEVEHDNVGTNLVIIIASGVLGKILGNKQIVCVGRELLWISLNGGVFEYIYKCVPCHLYISENSA